jgi:histidine phosphotransfer protein HptB
MAGRVGRTSNESIRFVDNLVTGGLKEGLLVKWGMASKVATLDHSVLADLRTLQKPGAPDFVQQVVGTFLKKCRERLVCLEGAVVSRNLEVVRKEAHSLKSSCGMIGALRMAQFCLELEDAPEPQIGQLVADLESELDQLVDALRDAGALSA